MCDEANGAPVALSDATMSAEASFQSRCIWQVSALQWEVD